MPVQPISDLKYLKGLKACLERMFRFCQRHNIFDPRIKIGYLAIEIGHAIDNDDVTPESVAGYKTRYAEIRRLIHGNLMDAEDLHKSGDDTACLIEEGMFLLNQVEDKLAYVTSNMAAMRRMGIDDFDSTIALAVAATGRSSLIRNNLTSTGLYALKDPKEDQLKAIVEKYRPLVQHLDTLDKILDSYLIQIPADIIGRAPETGKSGKTTDEETWDAIRGHLSENLSKWDEALQSLRSADAKWREKAYKGQTAYYLTLTGEWRLRLSPTVIPWAWDCDITDENHVAIVSPHVALKDGETPDIDDVKKEAVAAAIRTAESARTEYAEQLDQVQRWISDNQEN